MTPELEPYRSVVPSGLEAVVASLSPRKDAIVCFTKYLKKLQEGQRQDLGDLPFKVAKPRRILCLICAQVSTQVPHDVIPTDKKPAGKGCPVCAGNSPEASKAKYLEKLLGQNAQDLDDSPYSCHVDRKILCNKCGNTRERRPHNVLCGHGCPVCMDQDHLASEKKYLKALAAQQRQDMDSKEYRIMSKRHILCTICGKEADQNVGNIINNHHGCPNCAWKVSKKEETVRAYVLSLCQDAIHNQKKILRNHNFELDIYVPSLKRAIEFDGTFWHKSEWAVTHGAATRDLSKDEQCAEAGIQLLRIAEEEFDRDPGAVLTRIKAFLAIT